MAEIKCDTCPYLNRIEVIEKDLNRNSDQHREFYKRFNELDTSIAISSERYNNLLTNMAELKVAVGDVKDGVTELKEKPAKKWDNVSMYVITAIIGIVLGIVGKTIFP